MLLRTLEAGLVRALRTGAGNRAFPLVVAGVALAATLSMSVPYGGLLVAAVLLAPRRWIAIAAGSSLGAAAGALALYLVFHHLGWNRFVVSYPDVVRSTAWRDATVWLTSYGVWSLLIIAATPLPLTPALMFAAISRLPVAEVIFALWIGKFVKYLGYSWVAAHFPELLLRRRRRQMEEWGAVLSHVSSPSRPPKESV